MKKELTKIEQTHENEMRKHEALSFKYEMWEDRIDDMKKKLNQAEDMKDKAFKEMNEHVLGDLMQAQHAYYFREDVTKEE